MQDKYFFIELGVCTLVSLFCTEVCWHSFVTKHVGTTGQSTIHIWCACAILPDIARVIISDQLS